MMAQVRDSFFVQITIQYFLKNRGLIILMRQHTKVVLAYFKRYSQKKISGDKPLVEKL